MKVVIFAAAGLVAGLGGGTAWRALQVKTEVEAQYIAAADSAAAALADSLAAAHAAGRPEDADGHDGETHERDGHTDAAGASPDLGSGDDHADGGEDTSEAEESQLQIAGGTAPGDEAARADDPDISPADGVSADDEEAASADGDEAPQAEEPEEVDGPAGTEEGARRLARVFSAMRPRDAAAVLAELSDPEVEAILLRLGDRTAGQILSTFPAERAAVLSRRVLGREGGEE